MGMASPLAHHLLHNHHDTISAWFRRHVPRIKFLDVQNDISCYISAQNLHQVRASRGWEASRTRAQSGDEKKGIMITGGTKGLGLSLAREFLAANEKVVICGRNEDRLNAAITSLQTEFDTCSIQGIRCDVSNASDVAALASFAAEKLGTIHFWINNASSYMEFVQRSAAK